MKFEFNEGEMKTTVVNEEKANGRFMYVNNKVFPNVMAEEGYEAHWQHELSETDYHADKTAVNSSSVRKMIKSPKAFYSSFFLGKNPAPSAAMKFGTLAHMAILEGAKFRERYVVMPEIMGLTLDGKMSTQSKSAKEKRAAWMAEQPPGTLIVTEEERDDLFGMIDSILSHEQAHKLLSQGSPEISGYWRDEETGIRCRLRADFVSFNLNTFVDVKTTTSCLWDDFRWSVENLRYDVQAAFYREGITAITGKEPDHSVWLAIESKCPYEVGLYEIPPQYEGSGKYECRRAIKRIKDCVKTWQWPQGQVNVEYGEMSPWFFKKYEGTTAFDET